MDTTDTVMRRIEWQKEHPDVHISLRPKKPALSSSYWEARWTDQDGTQRSKIAIGLGELLDQLDALPWRDETT